MFSHDIPALHTSLFYHDGVDDSTASNLTCCLACHQPSFAASLPRVTCPKQEPDKNNAVFVVATSASHQAAIATSATGTANPDAEDLHEDVKVCGEIADFVDELADTDSD